MRGRGYVSGAFGSSHANLPALSCVKPYLPAFLAALRPHARGYVASRGACHVECSCFASPSDKIEHSSKHGKSFRK